MSSHLPVRAPAPGGAPAGSYAARGEPADDALDVRTIRETLRRRWRTICSVTLAAVALAAAVTVWMPPVWSTAALIRVDEKEGGLIAPSGLEALTSLAGGGEIETEMRMLRTRPTAEDVVDQLDLHFRMSEPLEVPRESFFTSIDFGRLTVDAEYRIEPAAGGRYRIVSTGGDGPPLDREFAPGDPVEIPGGTFVLADLARGTDREGAPLPTSIAIETVLFQRAVEDLFEEMTVTRPDRDANVIRVGYRSTDIALAPEVPNAMAETFIVRRLAMNREDASGTVRFLAEQVEDTRRRLEDIESRMQRFREGEQIVALGAEAEAQVQRLATLETQRTALDTERSALAELLADIDSSDGAPDYRRLAAFPTFFRNEAVAGILQELIQADRARTELLVRVTPSHPDLVAIDERTDQLELQLAAIGRNYLRSLQSQIDALEAELGRFGTELERIPAREIQFARMVREAEMLGDLYALLATRLKEAEVAEAIDDASVRIVEYAIEPLEPESPRPVRNIALAMVLGLMLGVLLAFAREAMDPRLRSSDRIEDLYGLPTMARIPALAARNGEGRRRALVTVHDAHSVAAESYRNLRTNVGNARGGRGANELVITCPAPDGGKSLAAANLAVALAQRGRATVLVDADLRHPRQHALFGAERAPGLSDCLSADEPLEAAFRTTGIDALTLLPAGRPTAYPAELLDSARLDRLLDTLRARFDAVILDAPPVLAVADSAILAPRTDGVILVVRAGVTDREAIAAAIEQLRRADADVLGVVVGDARPAGSYEGYHSAAGDPDAGGGIRRLLRRIQDPS